MEHYNCHNNWNFYKQKSKIRLPDEVFEPIHLDPGARDMEEVAHPLLKRSHLSGCYLIYTYYDWGEGTEICPIYAGRAKSLSSRLCNHHNSDTGKIISFYEDYVDEGLMEKIVTREDGKQYTIKPEELVYVAIWFEDSERERMFLEHGLIHAYRPTMNFN